MQARVTRRRRLPGAFVLLGGSSVLFVSGSSMDAALARPCVLARLKFDLTLQRELLYLREYSSNAHKISHKSYVASGELRSVPAVAADRLAPHDDRLFYAAIESSAVATASPSGAIPEGHTRLRDGWGVPLLPFGCEFCPLVHNPQIATDG